MVNIDLYLSQALFQFGRALPAILPVALASVLIWFLFAYVLYAASRLRPARVGLVFLGRAVLSAVIGLGITALIAYFYFRLRPFAALNFTPLIVKSALSKSFPSDHAVVAGALAMTLFLHKKSGGYYVLAAALLIALGRVLVGVHYLSDVLVGVGLGVVLGWLVFKISASATAGIQGGR